MFFILQTLVFGLNVLKYGYTKVDHVKNTLSSLQSKWRPKITTIMEAKDLDNLALEKLTSSLKNHEIELVEDEPK